MNVIGIVGGVGPYAGLDLAQKIFDQTRASSDQDHLPVALLSLPEKIEDRTRYLVGETNINPAYAVGGIIEKLEQLGAGIVGIPCNTMHAPEIFDVILDELKKRKSGIKLLNMPEEVVDFIGAHFPDVEKVGILSTTGTWKAGIYPAALKNRGYVPVVPDEQWQQEIHDAVYHPVYGIKAQSRPVDKQALDTLEKGIRYLKQKGARGIVLGCTEMTFALQSLLLYGTPIFDSNLILARALIYNTCPGKLKSLEGYWNSPEND